MIESLRHKRILFLLPFLYHYLSGNPRSYPIISLIPLRALKWLYINGFVPLLEFGSPKVPARITIHQTQFALSRMWLWIPPPPFPGYNNGEYAADLTYGLTNSKVTPTLVGLSADEDDEETRLDESSNRVNKFASNPTAVMRFNNGPTIFNYKTLWYIIGHLLGAQLSYVEPNVQIQIDPNSLSLELGDVKSINITLNQPAPIDLIFNFTYRDADGNYVDFGSHSAVEPLDSLIIRRGEKGPVEVKVVSLSPGQVILGLNQTSGSLVVEGLEKANCDVIVLHFHWLDVFQIVIGWIYFLAWTVSFYPQVFLNWRRKSVVGLNLDFLLLNLIGFLVYSVFNLALYLSPVLQTEYRHAHPTGVIPVLPNDIFFSVHAFAMCLITGVQVLIYERGGQRISRICFIILGIIALYSLINTILAGCAVMSWLTFIYNLSYVKLAITLIKYIPQCVMNCRRRSTIGWSIGNICLDMTGGVLSLLQMFLIAYNIDDWSSTFGSPTKLGLGLFSIMFDIFFMVQHWCLFRHSGPYIEPVASPTTSTERLARDLPLGYQSTSDKDLSRV